MVPVKVDKTNVRTGVILRVLRKHRGHSLKDIEELTNGNVKASILSAYERGERAITVPRLLYILDLYNYKASSFFYRLEKAEEELQ